MATASRSSAIIAETTTAIHDAYNAACHTITYRVITVADGLHIASLAVASYATGLGHQPRAGDTPEAEITSK